MLYVPQIGQNVPSLCQPWQTWLHKHTHGCKSATAWTHSQRNIGQETHHADSTALKWGTWFISFQSWIVMPYNTSLSLDIQLWGKDPQHGTKPQLWFHNFNFPYRFQGSKHYVVRLFLLLLLFGSQRYHTDNPVKNDQSLELACTMGPLLQVVNKVQHSFP